MVNEKGVEIPVKISEDVNQIYITGAFGGFTQYDFRIMLYNDVFQVNDKNKTEASLVHECKNQLIMSPLAAKELRDWLDRNIKKYEENVGSINVPNVKGSKR